MQRCIVQPRAIGARVQAPQQHRSQAGACLQAAGPPSRLPGRQPSRVVALSFFGSKSTDSNSATSGREAQEVLVSDGAIKSLSPEARRIFREAQDNIIELNKSRLRALEELKAARQKIAELEDKLEQAVAEATQATAQLQQLGPGSSQAAAAAAAAAAAVSYQQPPPPAVQQQPPAAAPRPPPPAPVNTITLVYETGWNNAYIHHNTDNKGWTNVPGTQMQNGSQQFPDKKVVTIPGSRMEFVVNNGGSDWDKPGMGAGPNYVVSEPGTYRIKNGKLTRLS